VLSSQWTRSSLDRFPVWSSQELQHKPTHVVSSVLIAECRKRRQLFVEEAYSTIQQTMTPWSLSKPKYNLKITTRPVRFRIRNGWLGLELGSSLMIFCICSLTHSLHGSLPNSTHSLTPLIEQRSPCTCLVCFDLLVYWVELSCACSCLIHQTARTYLTVHTYCCCCP